MLLKLECSIEDVYRCELFNHHIVQIDAIPLLLFIMFSFFLYLSSLIKKKKRLILGKSHAMRVQEARNT